MKEILFESLKREASSGANMRTLEAEIAKQGERLTDVERDEAWLFAWALKKRHERDLLGSARRDRGYGYTGDTGAG
jgi:hypothetical protein